MYDWKYSSQISELKYVLDLIIFFNRSKGIDFRKLSDFKSETRFNSSHDSHVSTAS